MNLASLTALLALVSSPSAVLPGGDGLDWPQWRGPGRDGISLETGWSSTGSPEDLWRAEVGRGYSCVAVAEGRLFTKGFDQATGMDVVRCLDAWTGEELWSHASPSKLWDNMHEGGTLSTPVVDGERVYVQSRLGTLTCFQARDGKVVFERKLIEDEKGLGFFGLASSPLVLEDRLVLNLAPTFALDKASGKTLWQTRDYGYSYSGIGGPSA